MAWFLRGGAEVNADTITRYTFRGHVPRLHTEDPKKGVALFTYCPRCDRCGGEGGRAQWAATGGTCYKCGGHGTTGSRTVKAYSADKLTKLVAAQQRAWDKKEAKRKAVADAKLADEQERYDAWLQTVPPTFVTRLTARAPQNEFLTEMLGRVSDRRPLTGPQLDAALRALDRMDADDAKAAESRHAGVVGARLRGVRVTCVFFKDLSDDERTRYMYKLEAGGGVTLVYFGAARGMPELNGTATIDFTVKKLDEYRGSKQTIIERPKVVA